MMLFTRAAARCGSSMRPCRWAFRQAGGQRGQAGARLRAAVSWPALVLALLGTAAWVWLVRWRTGRHREALWKSLVLPAGGVALCWLLLMTLGLPILDYARSNRPLVERLAPHLPADACVAAPEASPTLVASLEVFGGYRVDARHGTADTRCNYLVRVEPLNRASPTPPGWTRIARERRPTDRNNLTAVYRRQPAG